MIDGEGQYWCWNYSCTQTSSCSHGFAMHTKTNPELVSRRCLLKWDFFVLVTFGCYDEIPWPASMYRRKSLFWLTFPTGGVHNIRGGMVAVGWSRKLREHNFIACRKQRGWTGSGWGWKHCLQQGSTSWRACTPRSPPPHPHPHPPTLITS